MTALDDRAVAGLRALLGELGPGDVVDDRFELRELIGEGGMGVVFAAWDRETQHEVAVKIVRTNNAHDAARFEREAAALATIRHPAVVRYLARGVHDGASYCVMERLVGCTLSERLARGPLTVSEAVMLGRRIADGLAAVHRAGVAHRDVKPSNVFLVSDTVQSAQLLDFGLARHTEGAPLTETGALLGTPGYMAPEQVRGDRAGPHADVFALGCVLFECLTGRAAFRGAKTETLLAQILLETPPLVRAFRNHVPLSLEGLIERMLEKRPGARPDADEVARELAVLEGRLPTEVGAPTASEPAPGVAEGTIIAGKYRVERRIGEGGMGIVVAARHVELGKRVALKLLRSGEASDHARFLREAQAAARLESEHVARVLDVGRTEEGAPYIVMEFLNGMDLARRLLDGGPLPVDTAVGYLLQACQALGEAHSIGIVHRDIKPSNLFVTARRDGTEIVKVLDFGISKIAHLPHGASAGASGSTASGGLDVVTMTGPHEVMGSLWYMSPEQLKNSRQVDARTDIWALGVVLQELLTGSRPFHGDNAAAVGARIAAADPTHLRDAAAELPAELEAVVLRCLNKDPDQRFPDVAAFARALLPFAAHGKGASVARVASVPRSRRRPLLAMVGAVVVGLAAGGAVLRRAGAPKEEAPVPVAPPLAASPYADSSVMSAAQRAPAPASAPAPATNAAPSPLPSALSAMTAASATAAAPRPRPGPVLRAVTPSPSRLAAPPASSNSRPDLDLRDPALEGR